MINIIDEKRTIKRISLDRIVVDPNYRTNFSLSDLAELGSSIKSTGPLQPPIVNQTSDGKYHLIAGQRRYCAMKEINLKATDFVVFFNLNPQQVKEIQLSENFKKEIGVVARSESISRSKKALEKAEKKTYSNAELARRLQISPDLIGNAEKFANLIPELKNYARKGLMSYSVALQLSRLSPDDQEGWVDQAKYGKLAHANAKKIRKQVSDLIERMERQRKNEKQILEIEHFSLDYTPGEADDRKYLKSRMLKTCSESFQKAASHLKCLDAIIEENSSAADLIRNAKCSGMMITTLLKELENYAQELEKKFLEYNSQGLHDALHPKSPRQILMEKLKKRKITKKGESATDLLKKAKYMEIPVNILYRDKNQPRRIQDPSYKDFVRKLADNIKVHGVLNPIIVLKKPSSEGRYRIVIGESRWRGSKKARLKNIFAKAVEKLDDISCLIIQLAEDIFKKDSPVERAEAIYSLRKLKEKSRDYNEKEFLKEVEVLLGMDDHEVRKYLRIVSLDSYTKSMFESKKISFSAALELSRITNTKQRKNLCHRIIVDKLSLESVRKIIRSAIEFDKEYMKGKIIKAHYQLNGECRLAAEEDTYARLIDQSIPILKTLADSLEKLFRYDKREDQERFYSNNSFVESYVGFIKTMNSFQESIGRRRL